MTSCIIKVGVFEYSEMTSCIIKVGVFEYSENDVMHYKGWCFGISEYDVMHYKGWCFGISEIMKKLLDTCASSSKANVVQNYHYCLIKLRINKLFAC